MTQFSSFAYLQTFVPFVPPLLLAAPTIYTLQTLLSTLLLSPYFVEDVTANAALKEEAVIVFLPNTPCIIRPEDGISPCISF